MGDRAAGRQVGVVWLRGALCVSAPRARGTCAGLGVSGGSIASGAGREQRCMCASVQRTVGNIFMVIRPIERLYRKRDSLINDSWRGLAPSWLPLGRQWLRREGPN